MKTFLRRFENNRDLLILFGTWGIDEKAFSNLCTDNHDFILFYNYSADEPLILPEMKTYRRVTVIGWSLGVWAAEYYSRKMGIKPDLTIAINGTPVAADDKYGIPLRIFEATLDNISNYSMAKFYLRLFGTRSRFELNRNHIPTRTEKSLHDELRWLYNRMMEPVQTGFVWDYSLIGTEDRIFRASNLTSYWSEHPETRQIIVDAPHYLFDNWNSLEELVRYVRRFRLSPFRNK
jgi:biotin synthesis protein BioG